MSDEKPSNTPADVKQPERPKLIQIMGPGPITGASDDDPSGIATYSQAGAQFGYDLGWTLIFSYPLMSAIQQISARIGRVTGRGLAGNLRQHFPKPVLLTLVALLLFANIINLGADLGAMAEALRLLIGGPQIAYVMLFALISVLLEVFMRYSRYVSVLKWLTLSLFAYVATVLVVRVPWGEVAHHLVVPQIQWTRAYMLAIVGLLGTTISPYLFFWQASQEVEEERENPDAKPLKQAPDQAPAEMARIRLDTDVGMAFSNIIALFILLTAAATLHPKGITDIGSAGQAAEALRPLAGEFAFALFALGIVGTGMLALPELAGSAAVAVGEAFKWRVGLANKPGRAKAFYATIAVATLAGAVLNLTTIDPMKALVWAAVVNGIVAVPVMAMTMIIASRTKVMGQFKLKGYLRVVGWIATAVMGAAVIGLTVL